MLRVEEFLDAPGIRKRILEYRRARNIYAQGDVGDSVLYIRAGAVQLSARSEAGRDVVVAVLGPGDFFGEGCMAGQPLRVGSANALTQCTVVVLRKREMLRLLRTRRGLADRFIAHMLGTSIRTEEALLGELFNHDERRLARTLLLLAHYGTPDKPRRVLPNLSDATLAKMAGTTRAHVQFFLKRFRRLGFIDAGRRLKINRSLLNVVLE
jgi:CRP/FNR family cyclic AMP-dependent transcriptional regulator